MVLDKSKIFFILSLSFLLGIFFRSFFDPNIFFIWAVMILVISIIIINHKNRAAIVFSLAILIFFLGLWRVDFSLKKIKNIKSFEEEISMIGTVVKEPEEKGWYKNTVVKIENDEKIIVRTGIFDEIGYGDKLEISCKPEIPKNFSEDFDYRMYLAKDKIYHICPKAEIKKIEIDQNNIYASVFKVKNKMESNVEQVIPRPESALASGLLFGGDKGLSEELKESFSRTGMTHIVAVSGYNVTIIAEYLMIMGILLGLWRRQAFYFAIFGIFLFVAMIGFPSSAIRAGLMGSLLLWAMKNGRLANIDNAILFAGTIMLLINPLSLRWDIGFQLSFLATLGIIKVFPLWEKYFIRKNKVLGLLEIVLLTISAQIFVVPIILYNFNTLSIISILANLLVLPIIPITMLAVFMAAIMGFVFYPMSLVFGWVSYFLLHYEIAVVESLSRLSWSSMTIDNFGITGMILWYGIVFFLVYRISKLKNREV